MSNKPPTSVWQYANKQIRDLDTYEPGKPIADLARELGIPEEKILKLASNENPIGPSPKALEAMRQALERAHYYPDGGGYYLRGAVAEKFGLERKNVILGNGSNEIIELLGHAFLQPGDEIISSHHAFVVYHIMAQLFGAKSIRVPEKSGFVPDIDGMLAAITPRTRQLFLASPNNPTGTIASAADIEKLMSKIPDHVTVVFDEAYCEFLNNPPDTLRYVREGRNAIILHTFSKIQGLANLRIGYGIAHAELIDILQKTRQPFNANGIAQAGAVASLSDTEHLEKVRKINLEGRTYLQQSFHELGIPYIPSHANFVMVNVGKARDVFHQLLKLGIIVRALDTYDLPEWVRVTVATMDKNQQFVAALKKVLGR